MKKIFSLMTMFALIFTIGCSPQSPLEFNINFIVDGEVYATAKTDKNTIHMPDDPIKAGHEFDEWFWDEDVWENLFTLNSIPDDTPTFETLSVYAKFTETENPLASARFYRLQEAYDLGLLTYEDLFETSFYHNGDWSGVPHGTAISRGPLPKTPEFLSTETENKIKQTFLDDYKLNHFEEIYYTIDDISISNYCGTYSNAVIVYLEGLNVYTEAEWSETIEDISFYYNNGNYLRVWVENGEQSISFQVGAIDNSMGSREDHELLTIARSKDELNEAASTRYYQYWTDNGGPYNVYYLAELTEKYDEEFFAENALVLYLFDAANAGGTVAINELQKQGTKLIISTDFHMGMWEALSYWTVVIEVAQTDVFDVTKIDIINECKCPPPLVNIVFVVLTHEATVSAYITNKTYTPIDFPEYDFSMVENLFIMEPTGPHFKRILFLYLAEPIEKDNENLLAAIELIGQRSDVESAEL